MSEPAAVTIRDLGREDETAWRDLWAGYLRFYEASLPQETTDLTWERVVGDDPAFGGLVAVDGNADGAILGIANYILHPSTWGTTPFCLLNDLYVSPAARGKGAGRALIDALIARGREQGWARVYWVTKESNATARVLYDSYGPADGFIRYTVKL
ncbi:MAG: GNAT family N-acetyltransferase [Thermomicrobiales bacterium]